MWQHEDLAVFGDQETSCKAHVILSQLLLNTSLSTNTFQRHTIYN